MSVTKGAIIPGRVAAMLLIPMTTPAYGGAISSGLTNTPDIAGLIEPTDSTRYITAML